MWTSAAGPVRRLGLLARYQAYEALPSMCTRLSYSVLAVVRSKYLQGCHTSLQPSVCRFLSSGGINPNHQPNDSKPSTVMKLTVSAVSPTTPRDRQTTSVISSDHSVMEDSPGVAGSDLHQPSAGPLQGDLVDSSDFKLQSDPGQPSANQLRGDLGQPQAGHLPVLSHGLAPYVASSPGLRRLVALGVDVSGWDRRPGIPQMVLRLEWERHIAPHVQWLHDAGVPADRLGRFITRNPLIFKERLDNLQVRVNYLTAKRFNREQIISVISRAPFWLMFSTSRIDRRLGFFMRTFDLHAAEVRQLATTWPRLITSNIQHIKDSTFTLKEEFGFERHELKLILLGKPKVWMLSRSALQDRLQFLHNEMGLSHQLIADAPSVLTHRTCRVRQRHLMLNMLGRDQYDKSRPGYVALGSLVGTSDQEFCRDIAQVPVAAYNEFLKTL